MFFFTVKEYKAKLAKGKVKGDKVQRKPGTSPLPLGSHKTCLNLLAMSCENTNEILSINKLIRDLVPRILLRADHIRHCLPIMCQNCILAEGRQDKPHYSYK